MINLGDKLHDSTQKLQESTQQLYVETLLYH